MTVEELIEKLESMPQDAIVFFQDDTDFIRKIDAVEDIGNVAYDDEDSFNHVYLLEKQPHEEWGEPIEHN